MITYDYPPAGILLQVWTVTDEAEAKQIAGTFPAYLVRSKIDNVLRVFVAIPESVALLEDVIIPQLASALGKDGGS